MTLRGVTLAWGAASAADGWTVVTADGAWSAQFEQTVLVTARGVEVLTPAPG